MWLIVSQVGVPAIALSSLLVLAWSIAAKPAPVRAARLPIKPAKHRNKSAAAGFRF